MLKNTVKIILTVFVVSAFVFVFNGVYKNNSQFFSLKTLEIIKSKLNEAINGKDCTKIVEYSLGDVDKSFGLPRDQFLSAIKEAEIIWEKGAERDLFSYLEEGDLKISLVFDQRQEDTARMQDILGGITSDEGKLEAVKKEYDKLTAAVKLKEESFNANWAEYQKSQAQFEELVSVYNKKIADYEKQVDFWGAKGGAPKKEYEQLVQEKAEIDALYEQLSAQRKILQTTLLGIEAQRKEFNALVSQVNTIAGIFNRLAEKLNIRVDLFNEVQGSKEEFISGLYTSGASGETIEIFQFYDNKDLVITLAHELGHALGIGHATGTNSIMYPKSEGQKTQISAEDLQMLSALCN